MVGVSYIYELLGLGSRYKRIMSEDFDLQWIIHFECYHFLKHVYIKEFTAYCIQTSDYFTRFIKSPPGILFEASQVEIDTYTHQLSKHNLAWDFGELFWIDFIKILKTYISCNSSAVFVLNKTVYNYFKWDSRKSYTYKKLEPIDHLPNTITTSTCKINHSLRHCSENRVLNAIARLRPALVPYYIPEIVFDSHSYMKECQKLEDADNKSIKYGTHHLEPPLFTSLSTVNLSNGNCEHSLKGELARTIESLCCDADDPTREYFENDTPNEAAGTTGN